MVDVELRAVGRERRADQSLLAVARRRRPRSPASPPTVPSESTITMEPVLLDHVDPRVAGAEREGDRLREPARDRRQREGHGVQIGPGRPGPARACRPRRPAKRRACDQSGGQRRPATASSKEVHPHICSRHSVAGPFPPGHCLTDRPIPTPHGLLSDDRRASGRGRFRPGGQRGPDVAMTRPGALPVSGLPRRVVTRGRSKQVEFRVHRRPRRRVSVRGEHLRYECGNGGAGFRGSGPLARGTAPVALPASPTTRVPRRHPRRRRPLRRVPPHLADDVPLLSRRLGTQGARLADLRAARCRGVHRRVGLLALAGDGASRRPARRRCPALHPAPGLAHPARLLGRADPLGRARGAR